MPNALRAAGFSRVVLILFRNYFIAIESYMYIKNNRNVYSICMGACCLINLVSIGSSKGEGLSPFMEY